MQYITCVFSFGVAKNILFNISKSSCLRIGNCIREKYCKFYVGNVQLNWSTSIKYLGIHFSAGNALRIDVSNTKRRFYDSCNSILNKFKYVNEDVKLHLVKSFCSPLLTYSIGALSLTNQNFRDLAVCWNDAFRKIFNFKRWDSVKDLQFFFHELPFEQLYDYFRWKFLSATIHCSQSTILLHDLVSMEHRTI